MVHDTLFGKVRCEQRYDDYDGLSSWLEVYLEDENDGDYTYIGDFYNEYEELEEDGDSNADFIDELEGFIEDNLDKVADKGDKKLYVVTSLIMDENDTKNSILGVFESEKVAKQMALAELSDRYDYDVQDMYDNDESLLMFDADRLTFSSSIDFYVCSMEIKEVVLNKRMIDFKNE